MPHTAILEKTNTFSAFLFKNVSSGNRNISKLLLLAKECPCHLNAFQSGTFLQRKDICWISSTPFNHSCNNLGKDRVLPTFGPRSIFGAFHLWFDYRLVEGGVGYTYSYPKHLLLRVTMDHTFAGLCIVIPICPYLSLSISSVSAKTWN